MSAAVETLKEDDVRRFRDQQRQLLRLMLTISRMHQKHTGHGSLELHVLQLLMERDRRKEPMPIARDLAETLRVDKAAMSRVVAGLVKAGLVELEVQPQDARRQTLLLSDTGREFMNSLDEKAQDGNAKLLEKLSERQRRTMTEGLETYLELVGAAIIEGVEEPAAEDKKGSVERRKVGTRRSKRS